MAEVRIPLGPLAALPEGVLRRFPAGFRGVWVRRRGDVVVGYWDSCTHQAGALRPQGDRMVCTRHQATFDAVSGERLSGEAPEGSRLSRAELRVEDGALILVMPIND